MSDLRRVEKPWGYEIIWAHADKYVGKILHIKAGHKLSLQYHEIKDETVYVHTGSMTLVLEDNHGTLQEVLMQAGDARRIEPGKKHRMIAHTDTDVLEASTPELDDVVRLEDSYGRA